MRLDVATDDVDTNSCILNSASHETTHGEMLEHSLAYQETT